MSRQVSAVFVIDRWEEAPIEEHEGADLVRTEVAKTFTGAFGGPVSAG